MTQPRLFINGEPVILDNDTEIAMTFQINNLGELRNQQGNTTNQFSIPLTLGDNNRILGNPANLPFTTNIPYTQLKARAVHGGIEVIPNGVAEIKECSGRRAKVVVTSGNVDFFDLLEALISDLYEQFSAYQHTWDLTNAADSQENTSGWIYPIIDYGDGLTGNVDVRNLRPAFFLHTAVQEICDATGYTVSGDILTNELYLRILLPLSKTPFNHGKTFSDYLSTFRVEGTNPRGEDNPLIAAETARDWTIPFAATEDASGSWNGTTYTSKFTGRALVTFNFGIYVEVIYFGGVGDKTYSVDIQVFKNGVEQTSLSQVFTCKQSEEARNYENQVIITEMDFVPGDTLYFQARTENANNRVRGTIGAPQGSSALYLLSIDPIEEDVTFGQEVQVEKILPDVTQKELLKSIFQKFGIFCITDNRRKEIRLIQFSEIAANKIIADDWSDIMVNDDDVNVSYRLGNYAKVNKMLYTEDETITKGYGDSQINIANENLAAEAELFTSIFSATKTASYPGISTVPVQAPVIDMTKANYRILLDRKVEATVTFTDGTTTSSKDIISVPYFEGISDGLTWEHLRTANYSELEKVLYRCKKIVRRFRLTPTHIKELDFSKPVYIKQLGAYFYKNKIDSYVKGVPTKVELVRL